jgi:hypothetical protein
VTDDPEEPEAWKSKPWWDVLDVEVKEAWFTLADEEGLGPGDYDGARRVGERFGKEYSKLAAALAERYPDPEVTDPEEAWKLGLAMWMSENMVGEPFARGNADGDDLVGLE